MRPTRAIRTHTDPYGPTRTRVAPWDPARGARHALSFLAETDCSSGSASFLRLSRQTSGSSGPIGDRSGRARGQIGPSSGAGRSELWTGRAEGGTGQARGESGWGWDGSGQARGRVGLGMGRVGPSSGPGRAGDGTGRDGSGPVGPGLGTDERLLHHCDCVSAVCAGGAI